MIGQLAAGFLKGYGQTRLMEKQREDRKEMQELQKQLLKFKVSEQKTKQNLINLLMRGMETSPGGETEPGTGNVSEPQFSGGLLDMLSKGALPNNMQSMLALDTVGDYAGMDVMGAAKYGSDREQDLWNRKMDVARLSQGERRLKQSDISLKTVATPEGEFVVPVSKSGAQVGTGLKIGPSKSDQGIPLKDQPFWIHPETMKRAEPGMTPNQAKKLGLIQLPASQLEKVQKITAVKEVLEEVESLMTDVIPTKERGRIGGIARSLSAGLQFTEEGQKLAVLKDYIMANRAQVAKALGEVGNLSESEQEAVVKAFGDISDSGPKAWSQFKLLKKTFEKAKNNAFGISGETEGVQWKYNYDTGRLEPVK